MLYQVFYISFTRSSCCNSVLLGNYTANYNIVGDGQPNPRPAGVFSLAAWYLWYRSSTGVKSLRGRTYDTENAKIPHVEYYIRISNNTRTDRKKKRGWLRTADRRSKSAQSAEFARETTSAMGNAGGVKDRGPQGSPGAKHITRSSPCRRNTMVVRNQRKWASLWRKNSAKVPKGLKYQVEVHQRSHNVWKYNEYFV